MQTRGCLKYVTPAGTLYTEEDKRSLGSRAITDERRLELVQSVPLFHALESEDLEAVAAACEVKTFLEGEEAMRSGEKSQGMHILVSGQARRLVYKEVGTLSTGDTVGDGAMLKGLPFQESVEAVGGPITTLHLDSAKFRALALRTKIGAMQTQRRQGVKRRDCSVGATRRVSIVMQFERASADDDFAMITDAISSNQNIREVLNLTPDQIEFCAREAYKKDYAAGDMVFEKGDVGYRFYIVISGVFEVVHGDANAGGQDTGNVKLKHGDSFGELALLYNAPRTATVACKRAGSVWVLSRQTFRNCNQLKLEGKILEYSELLRTVEVFEQQGARMSAICNALEERYFMRDEFVIQQGAFAGCFYVIFEGECASIRDGQEEGRLGRGAFFCEGALLEPEVCPVAIKVVSNRCTVLTLDRTSFTALLSVDAESPQVSPLARLAGVNGDAVCRDDLERIGVLGTGAFGLVTLERHADSGMLYALKAMSKGNIARDGLKSVVVNEKLCLQILDSDFVVRLLATFRDDQYVYLLLEACFGGELFDLFQTHPEVCGSEAHARFYAACAAMGLEHMHSRRLIYRDLKLENCLLTLSGYMKLTDLGISKVCVGKTYTVCGTADYFAPEMLRQTGHNRAVDWWALGVMIFMMMTGRAPFEAPDTMKTYRKIIKGFAKVNFPEDFPDAAICMIRALCQRSPEERLTMGSLGIQNYKDHTWYRSFAWDRLETFNMEAPYAPVITEEEIIAKAQAKVADPLPNHPHEGEDDILQTDEAGNWDDVFDMSVGG